MSSAITRAAAHHCWQQEQWAHAEFYHMMESYQRADLGIAGKRPWRGIMSPSLLALIEQLERDGSYSASKLLEPRAKSTKLSPYSNSVYDYPIGRRVEAEKAERKLAE